LEECLDAKVKTADGEAFSCNRPNARSSRLDSLQQNIGFVDACSDACWPIQTSPSGNQNLSRIRISEAYLKGLLGIVSLRILNRIPVC
jgi:hypothetical protein